MILIVHLLLLWLQILPVVVAQSYPATYGCDEDGTCDNSGCDEDGTCDNSGCDAEGCDYGCDYDDGCDYSCDYNDGCDYGCDENGACDSTGCDESGCDGSGYAVLVFVNCSRQRCWLS